MTEDASDPADGGRADPEATESGADAAATGVDESPSDAPRSDAGDSGAEADGESRAVGDDGAAGESGDESDLVARAAEYDEELAADVADLRDRVDELESELAAKESETEDLSDRLKRTQADFQNYKKRAKKRQEQIRETATEDFVERVVTVRDNLVRALEQDEDADIRPGIESTLEEFDRVLADEDVTTIDPEPGAEVDPTRHEVMMRVDSDHPEGTVAEVYQPGYQMADKVIREAQVTVSTGGDE